VDETEALWSDSCSKESGAVGRVLGAAGRHGRNGAKWTSLMLEGTCVDRGSVTESDAAIEEDNSECTAAEEIGVDFGAKFVCMTLITASNNLFTIIKHSTQHIRPRCTTQTTNITTTHASDQNRAPDD
jgi:hypothetical protein